MEEALSKARALEKKYDWLQAKDVYEQVLGTVDKNDFLKRGELEEQIGYCLHRAAFQAESQEEFKERIGRAIEAYEKAQTTYEKSPSEEKSARINRCDAWTKYLGYWLERRPAEKLRLLDECLELESRALAAFWDLGNRLECGRTYGQFPLVFVARAELGWDMQALKNIIDQGIQWGEKAVTALSELGESVELARAHLALATCLGLLRSRFVEDWPPEIRNHLMKAFELA